MTSLFFKTLWWDDLIIKKNREEEEEEEEIEKTMWDLILPLPPASITKVALYVPAPPALQEKKIKTDASISVFNFESKNVLKTKTKAVFKTRAKKVPVTHKTSDYLQKRQINTIAAKKNRTQKQQEDKEQNKRCKESLKLSKQLRAEIVTVKHKLKQLLITYLINK